MGESLIDLDLPPAAPEPAEHRPLGSARRPVLVTVVVLAAAISLGGSGVAPRPRFGPPTKIVVGPTDAFLLLDDGLVVQAGGELRSYGLDGRPRWRARAAPEERLPAQSAAGVVLTSTAGAPSRTRALDRRTGAVRWERAGSVTAATSDLVIFAFGREGTLPKVGVSEFIAVRPDDGRTVWRQTIDRTDGRRPVEVVRHSAETGLSLGAYALVAADGTADLLDLATGSWRTLTGWPVQAGVGLDGQGYAVLPGGTGALVVWSHFGDRGWGYPPGAARPSWRTEPGERLSGLCDPWLCLSIDSGTRLVDPHSGVEGYRTGWPAVYGGTADRLLSGTGGTGAAGAGGTGAGLRGAGGSSGSRGADGSDVEGLGVVDLTTGRTMRRLTGWRPIRPAVGTWVPLLRRVGIRTWDVAALRLADGQAHLLGRFARAADDPCQASATHLVCGTVSGDLLLWRYRAD